MDQRYEEVVLEVLRVLRTMPQPDSLLVAQMPDFRLRMPEDYTTPEHFHGRWAASMHMLSKLNESIHTGLTIERGSAPKIDEAAVREGVIRFIQDSDVPEVRAINLLFMLRAPKGSERGLLQIWLADYALQFRPSWSGVHTSQIFPS